MHLLARLHRTRGIGCPFDVVKRWEKKSPGVCRYADAGIFWMLDVKGCSELFLVKLEFR
jgi:hypothetical protein